MLNTIIIGALIGIFMFFIIALLTDGSDIFNDTRRWWDKRSKGFLKGVFIAAVLGGIVTYLDDGNGGGSSCREFGRFASSC